MEYEASNKFSFFKIFYQILKLCGESFWILFWCVYTCMWHGVNKHKKQTRRIFKIRSRAILRKEICFDTINLATVVKFHENQMQIFREN